MIAWTMLGYSTCQYLNSASPPPTAADREKLGSLTICTALAAAPGVATVCPPFSMKPPLVVVSAPSAEATVEGDVAATRPLPLVVVLANWKLVVLADTPVAVDPTPTSPPEASTVPPVMMPPMVPVHAAPDGQHATEPAESAEHTASDTQHSDDAPRLAQESKPVGHVLLYCRLRTLCGAAAELLVEVGK